jgi:ligand-binding sensor domain-containing protein
MKSIKKVLIFLSVLILAGLSCKTLSHTVSTTDCNSSFCLGGISLIFKGQRLKEYTVQLQFPNAEPLIFSCPQGAIIFEEADYMFPIECSPEGIFLNTTEPTSLSLIVNWNDGSISQNYTLNYVTINPNDPECDTNCKSAKIELNFNNSGTPVAALFPTPTPTLLPMTEKTEQGKWELAGTETAGDWFTFQTPDINSVAIENDVIWAGAYGGLLRWDRTTGSVMQYLAPQIQLPDNDVSNIILYKNNLYIATETAIAIFDRQSQWIIYRNEEMGLGKDYGNEIAIADGEIWVANKTGLAHRSLDRQWSAISSGPDTFSLEIVSNVIAQSDGIYLVGAEKFGDLNDVTYRYTKGKWEKLTTNFPEGILSPDGTRWKGDYDKVYLSKDDGKTWEFAFQWEEYITPLAVDDQGRLYLASNATLLVYENQQFSEVYRFTSLGPELNYINIIQSDPLGRMWFATDGCGLTMFDGNKWQNWQPTNSVMRHDAIRGMAVTKEKVYAGGSSAAGEGGVMIYNIIQDQWANYWPGESELSGGGVEGIAVDKNGRVFFATATGILDILDNGEWSHVNMSPMPKRQILMTSDGLFDGEGNYWLGTEGLGLWKYDGKSWETIDRKSGSLPSNEVNALAIDQDGLLWIGTDDGLSVRCSEKKWKTFSIPGVSESVYFSDIAIDPQNRIWTTTNRDMLSVFNGKEWFSFPPSVVGKSMWDDAVAFDQNGWAWVSIDGGIGIFKGQLPLPPRQSIDCGNP